MGQRLRTGEFYGKAILTNRVGGFFLSDARYPRGTRLERHSHDRAYFCFIRRGCYAEQYGRRARVCRPNSLVFHPAGERHSETIWSRTVHSFNVEIAGEWLDAFADGSSTLDQPVEFHEGPITELASHLYAEFTSADSDSAASIESLCLEILSSFSQAAAPRPTAMPPKWLKSLLELIEAQAGRPMTLRQLAEEAGVHPVHLAATFRHFQCCSVGEFVRRRRVGMVREKLIESDLPLAEIALDAGFTDQSHMTRVFRRLTGKTPGQYRTFLRC